MINSWPNWSHRLFSRYTLFALLALLYSATMAQTPLFGDPTEYTFVAHTLGIAHPPGYAFITLLGKLFQTIIPFATVAWRMHLLSLIIALLLALAVHDFLLTLLPPHLPRHALAWLAVCTIAVGPNLWQHAIHANPHIITATFLAVNLAIFGRIAHASTPKQQRRWLALLGLTLGLGLTHHPLTLFSWPAYALAFLFFAISPQRKLSHRAFWLTPLLPLLVGLAPWLYFPLCAPTLDPARWPSDMNTLDGFLNLVLARGLRVNLFHFPITWDSQWDRWRVFLSLAQLQYSWPLLLLALLGLVWWWREGRWRWGCLLTIAFLTNYLFVINSVQDVMAYLNGPFLLLGVLIIGGVCALLTQISARYAVLLLACYALLGVGWSLWRTAPQITLRHDGDAADYVQEVQARFVGKGEGAVLLNDWEHQTPLWYAELVEGAGFASADLTPIFVSAAKPWIDLVYERLSGGAVYLSRWERSIFDAGFRLRPRGAVFQVVEPGDASIPPELRLTGVSADAPHIVGYQLPDQTWQAGDLVPLTLALRTPITTTNIIMPIVMLGELRYPFTTDSHTLSPSWLPNELIVEPFSFALPFTLPAGRYPLRAQLYDLIANQNVGEEVTLGEMVVASGGQRTLPPLLANLGQRVGLATATARHARKSFDAPWPASIVAQTGDTIHLALGWRVLASPETSYTVFVHLIDAGNRPIIDNLDYTPLGGAAPTHLWFAKWLPNQQYRDPYRLTLSDVPAGDYFIEVGMYEQFTRRRLPMYDETGNLLGDRFILGGVSIQP